MSDYADYLLRTSSGQFALDKHRAEGLYISAIRRSAPAAESSIVDDYASPWDALEVVVKAGGGALHFDSTRYKAAVLPLLTFCNGVGYKLPRS